MYEQLDYQNGAVQWVTLPMARYPLVAAMREAMRQDMDHVEFWDLSMDAGLWLYLRHYYEAIAAQLVPAISPIELKPSSRHRFFVASEAVKVGGELLPGLAGIDRLLGYGYAEPDQNAPIAVTSGDPGCDLLADLLIVFKDQALPLIDRYPLPYLNKLLKQTADRQDPEAQARLQKAADEELFKRVNAQAALRAHYESRGIPVPADF